MDTEKILYRSSDLAASQEQEQEKQIVTGYAIVFDSPTMLGRDSDGRAYYEVIKSGALAGCDLSDVVMRYNHNDDNLILARTLNNTLKLDIDEHGLKVTADIAPTTQGHDIYTLIKRGDISKMSFAFLPAAIDYDYNSNTTIITAIAKIRDVSAVDIPAYDDTSISASYRDLQAAKEEFERELRRKRQYLELSLKL